MNLSTDQKNLRVNQWIEELKTYQKPTFTTTTQEQLELRKKYIRMPTPEEVTPKRKYTRKAVDK